MVGHRLRRAVDRRRRGGRPSAGGQLAIGGEHVGRVASLGRGVTVGGNDQLERGRLLLLKAGYMGDGETAHSEADGFVHRGQLLMVAAVISRVIGVTADGKSGKGGS